MTCTVDDDELCCQCHEPLPDSAFDWWIGYGHIFCSQACATAWKAAS